MTFWHILTEAFFVAIIIFGAWAFVDTMRQGRNWRDDDDQ